MLDELDGVSLAELEEAIAKTVLPGMSPVQRRWAQVYAARSLIFKEPNYSYVAARLLLDIVYNEVMEKELTDALLGPAEVSAIYSDRFAHYIRHGIAVERLAPERRLRLGGAGPGAPPRTRSPFTYLGLQTLYDRYFLHDHGRRLETPQFFWMRVAMGLALQEDNPTARAIEFYEMMSTFRFCPSSPTLFNAGTRHPQLSSCFLTTIADDLSAIFQGIYNNAMLSKWSGGLGNDWTPVRALGSRIKGTNGKSQGVVPFL